MNMHNNKNLLEGISHIHFIGIGGSGMYPLVQILHKEGYKITGSDNNETDTLAAERAMGIEITLGHSKDNIKGADMIVYTAAILSDNEELIAAKNSGKPCIERSIMLGYITSRYKKAICISGTHGKTTTSSMATQILLDAGLDPSAVIGGKLPSIGGNGRAGKSDLMVCEACEFVDTFLQMTPDIAVLLNIDNDHLDYFKTMDNLILSFHKFLKMSSKAYINGDDALCLKAAKDTNAEIVTFGFEDTNDFYPENIKAGKFGFCYDVMSKGEKITSLELKAPGKHNVLNSLAAFSVCFEQGVSASGIKEALQSFTGAGRRFEFLGEYNGFTLADDYAHHPTEIKATLTAAKQLNYNNVIAVFQPFTFSRTALLKDEFIEALSIADKVILTPIMGSREVNTYGIKSEDIAERLECAVIVDGFENIADKIIETAKTGDIVITMGGGDIYKAAHIVQEKLG